MLRYEVARTAASVWRLNGLRLAKSTFAHTLRDTILERSLFDGIMPLDVGRTTVHQMLYLEGERWLLERSLLERTVDPGMRVIDVGANIGYYALLLVKLVGRYGSVRCIEPEPDNLRDLRRVVTRNGFENVTIIEAAAGASNGFVNLARGINGMVDGAGDVTVPLIRLDDLPGTADFMKIDVEGYEGEVLAGAKRLLDGRPRLFLELHPAMLVAPHTIDSIYQTLIDCYGDSAIAFYEAPQLPFLPKLRARYLAGNPVRRVRRDELLAASRDGSRTSPFWAVCVS